MDKIGEDADSRQDIDLERKWVAHNYHPLPVVVESARGSWVRDRSGREYLDCLAGYSALNFGHLNPRLVGALQGQLSRVSMTSRAFYNDRLGTFGRLLAKMAGAEMILPMNTGAEAVESAIKVARAWGYRRKGVTEDRANIVVMEQNFHGRTTTIVSFSSDPSARDDFGPFGSGFRAVPFGDSKAVAAAVDEDTVAILVEPIQGEAGVIIPPDDFLPGLRQLCDQENILLIADEIQSGLGRTGKTFACDWWGVKPDLYTLGKALGGGLLPVSAVVGSREVLGVLRPGEHGSTFGGNPLACAVGIEVVNMLEEGTYQERALLLGARLREWLEPLVGQGVTGFSQIGLWSGVTIDPHLGSGRQFCERLAQAGVLAKDTHGSTIRLSPPLTLTDQELAHLGGTLTAVLERWGSEVS